MRRARTIVVVLVALATAASCSSSRPTTVESLGSPETTETTAVSDSDSASASADSITVTVPGSAIEGSTTSVGPTESGPTTTEGELTPPTPPLMTTTTPWTPPPRTDCGSFDLASGWPTTTAPSPSAGRCLYDAFESGLAARLVVSEQTDGNGGAPVVTSYMTGPQHVVHVTIDATRAADRPQVVTELRCTELDASVWPPKASACVAA